MTDRHLLPEEIELFLDDETAVGTESLADHLARCSLCRSELVQARGVVAALGNLPRFAPSPWFASRVMRHVQMPVPWYVAAGDVVRSFVPRSRGTRAAALTLASVSSTAISAVLVWVLAQPEALAFMAAAGAAMLRDLVLDGAGQVTVALFGEQSLPLLLDFGMLGFLVLGATVAAAMTGTLASLRGMAHASTRHRR